MTLENALAESINDSASLEENGMMWQVDGSMGGDDWISAYGQAGYPVEPYATGTRAHVMGTLPPDIAQSGEWEPARDEGEE